MFPVSHYNMPGRLSQASYLTGLSEGNSPEVQSVTQPSLNNQRYFELAFTTLPLQADWPTI